jgi:hypothetical protein
VLGELGGEWVVREKEEAGRKGRRSRRKRR